MQSRKIAVVLYDADSCTLAGEYSIDPKPEKPIEKWLINDNETFLEKQIERFNSEKFDLVILSVFSARQSKKADQSNKEFMFKIYGSPIDHVPVSITSVLPVLQSYFQLRLKNCKVMINLTLTADVYSNSINHGVKKAGDSYKLIAKEEFNNDFKFTPEFESKLPHSDIIGDRNKFSFIYLHAHQAASYVYNEYAGETKPEIVLIACDDSERIFDNLAKSIQAAPELLPPCKIELHQYDGTNYNKLYDLKGIGEIDTKPDWGIRLLFSMAKTPSDSKDLLIESAAALQKAHEENFYFNPSPAIMKLEVNTTTKTLGEGKATVMDFLKFRNTEFQKLVSTLGKPGLCYTSAQALYDEGLIPKLFVIHKKGSSLKELLKQNSLHQTLMSKVSIKHFESVKSLYQQKHENNSTSKITYSNGSITSF